MSDAWHAEEGVGVLARVYGLRYDSPDEMTRPNSLCSFLLAVSAVSLAAVLAACGGGDDEDVQPGALTDPREAPTAPPWDTPPEVVILDPEAIQPIAPEGATPTPGAAVSGQCGPKYTIQSGDTFSSIAERCGTTTQGMRDANPGVDPLTLKAGQEVNVPAPQPSP